MADTKPEVDCISESPAMSDNVRNVAIESGMVENMGVAVGILSISHPCLKFNVLPVYRRKFRFRFPVVRNVGTVIIESEIVDNVVVNL